MKSVKAFLYNQFLLLTCLCLRPFYFCTSRKLSAAESSQNRRCNEEVPSCKEPIHDQRKPPANQFHVGRFLASYNGCACIAVFNALLCRQTYVSFPALIAQFEEKGCLCLQGKFGVNPYRLPRILKELAVPFSCYHRLSALEAAMCTNDTAILFIWNDRADLRQGAHFFTVQKQHSGYTVYNRLAAVKSYETLADIIGKGMFITGCRLF